MNNATPSVSVIIAVRNGEHYLGDAIESILAGELTPSEIVVIDGHSTDGTSRIASSYREVTYRMQNGVGIADAYNQGIQSSSGQLVGFLSSDDLWDARKLRLQVDYMTAHPESDLCVCLVRHFADDKSTLPSGFRQELLDEDRVAFIMETLLARRSVFDSVGLFDTTYEVAEDVDWFARANDMGITTGVVHEVLVRKRVHDRNASLTTPVNNELLLKALRASIKRKRGS